MPQKFEFWLPVSPFKINQAFGQNPAYYARFKDQFGNPEKGHMGTDLFAPHATPLYSPIAGEAWYETDEHGGDGIYIRTNEAFLYGATTAFFDMILWHLCSKDDPQFKPLIPTDGSKVPVTVGQLIGYTDNSGAPFESSGDHLHVGLVPTNAANQALEASNGFGGCIDPMPYCNLKFATDYLVAEKAIAAATEAIAQLKPTTPPPPITPEAKKTLLQSLTSISALLIYLKNLFQ